MKRLAYILTILISLISLTSAQAYADTTFIPTRLSARQRLALNEIRHRFDPDLLRSQLAILGETYVQQGPDAVRPMMPDVSGHFRQCLYTAIWHTPFHLRNDVMPDERQFFMRLNIILALSAGDQFFRQEAYNTILFLKGLLLNRDSSLKEFVENSGDDIALRYYTRYIAAADSCNRSVAKGLTPDLRQLNDIEMALMAQCHLIDKNFSSKMERSWLDVRNALQPGEAAIEFIATPLRSDSIAYSALVISHDSEAPVAVRLFNEQQLLDLPPRHRATSPATFNLVWSRLMPLLSGKKRIFFAPDRLLHRLPIEYLAPDSAAALMNEIFDIHRLSSTRQLCSRSNTDIAFDRFIIAAGIDYSIDNDKSSSPPSTPDCPASLRARFANLPHTYDEGAHICRIFADADCLLLDGRNATESKFRSLIDHRPGIIHIASHGFYWTPEEADYISRLPFVGSRAADGAALLRSGLILSGANAVFSTDANPNLSDDGFLTAQEIASLDLSHIRLTTLSACCSALGDISPEGVWGLQRAIKSAGAGAIVASLDNIDDLATSIFMKQFYTSLAKHRRITPSIRDAQQSLRDYSDENGNHPFANPRFWTAFIAIDDI